MCEVIRFDEVGTKIGKSFFPSKVLKNRLIFVGRVNLMQVCSILVNPTICRDGNMILAKYVAWYSWLAMDVFFRCCGQLGALRQRIKSSTTNDMKKKRFFSFV